MLKIIFGGELKEYTPDKKREIELDVLLPCTIREILNQINFNINYIGVVVSNGKSCNLDQMVDDESEIKLFPIIGGG